MAFIGRHWIKGARVIERAAMALPSLGRRVVRECGEPRSERRILARNVELWNLGRLQPDEVHTMYGASDIGVVPSVVEETFPLAALEMMACALPVIASRVVAFPNSSTMASPAGSSIFPTPSTYGSTPSSDS